MERFAKIVISINSKLLTILAKSSILDARLGPECVSTGRYNTNLKIQMELSPRQQVKMESF